MTKREKAKLNEELKVDRVTNNDLVCNDCVFCLDDTEVYSNTSKCKIFNLKPNHVFENKSICVAYRKENK